MKISTEQRSSAQEAEQKYIRFISDFLVKIGVPKHYSGHEYFTYAIFIAGKDPCKLHHVTKEIYPEVAMKYGISAENVERNMRNALDAAWKREAIRQYPELFKSHGFNNGSRPTNTEFLSAVLEFIDLG